MNRIKMAFAKRFFKELLPVSGVNQQDASGTGGGAGRELASEFVKRIVYKENGDTDFEDPEFDLADIQNGYNTDSYIRQGVDKYVDQIFKEGYNFFGTDTNAVEYLKLRLAYIAEASNTPTSQLLMDIAEDVVKYGNCMVVKARNSDPNALPQGASVTGLYGKDPVVGYFCANPVTMKCKRDEYGTVTEWQQDNDGGTTTFAPEDVVHFYYKREKGNAYGTSFLIPVLDDVRALRQAEENVLKMMYRNIYPFYHIAVGTEDATGTSNEVDQLKEALDGMDVEGGLVTTERVKITPVASDKVIDAEPYLKYMEERVFSGMGIPAIMFGRGNCYDEETQTLTDHGWKFWFEVSSNDKIATYNPDTGHIEYHKPNDDLMKYVSHYKGQMVHFKSKHVDIKVSPQHDMWVCTNGRQAGKMKWKKMKAIDLYNSGIQNFYFMEQTNGIDDVYEEQYPYITIPFVESRYTNGNNNITTFDTHAFVEFLGYFISKGSLNPSKVGKYCISISQKKEDILDKILACVAKLNISYNIRYDNRDNTTEITIYHKSLWSYLKDNFGLYDKDRYISREILNLSPSSLKILLNALIDGDGTRDNRPGRTSMSYYSISENLIDNVQELCVKLGYKAKIIYGKPEHSSVHRVMISDSCNNYRYCTRNMITLEDYDGIMYCYNVPNHLFVTRRNGKVAIQGNTANRSTGDNMTSEMADRIRAISRVIEMFFNSFIVKELLMEGGYDPVLNPDQNVEFRFNDNDVDVMIKKEVHAIYKYEHNAITEDEMRDELGKDPIPDGDREKMFVELITRETLRVEAELNMALAKETANQSAQTGTKETNNKQKNQGGTGNKKSSSTKNSIDPVSIGLIKDSIDNLEVSIDNYIKDCFVSRQQILQTKLMEKVIDCNKEILYTISKNSEVKDEIASKISKLSTKLVNDIHGDLIGINTYANSESSVIDIIDVRVSIYKDSLIKYISNYKSLKAQLIERGS